MQTHVAAGSATRWICVAVASSSKTSEVDVSTGTSEGLGFLRRQVLGVLVFGAMLSALAGPTALVTGAGGNTSTAASIEEAIRFRTDFALPNSRAFVEGAASNPGLFPNTDWGVPLTSDEARELARRVAVQLSLDDATRYASGEHDYAGAYIDQGRGGLPVFMFTGRLDGHRQALAERAPGISFEVGLATRSESDLIRLQEAVESAREELRRGGIEIVLTGIDPRKNQVIVGVPEVSATASATLEARFGDGIKVRQNGQAQADACTVSSCWPQKGGIRVYSIAMSNSCTSGYVAKRSDTGELALVTAGHCIYVGGTGNWAHDISTHTIGPTTGHTWVTGADADVAFIRMTVSAPPSVKNQVLRFDEGIYSLTAVADTTAQLVGGAVCRTGYGTKLQGGNGRTCGTIVAANVSKPSCVGTTCRTIDHTWEVSFDSTSGDSGGPVYAGVTDPGYGTGYGTHVHSDPDGTPGAHGWYSPLGWGQAEFFNRFGVLYRYCLNSSCTVTGP